MKKYRFCIFLLLCLSLCVSLLPVAALADSSAAGTSEGDGVALSPVEQAFQVISLVILFGGIAMLPVYYVLNKRRRRIIASFEEPKEPEENKAETENDANE